MKARLTFFGLLLALPWLVSGGPPATRPARPPTVEERLARMEARLAALEEALSLAPRSGVASTDTRPPAEPGVAPDSASALRRDWDAWQREARRQNEEMRREVRELGQALTELRRDTQHGRGNSSSADVARDDVRDLDRQLERAEMANADLRRSLSDLSNQVRELQRSVDRLERR